MPHSQSGTRFYLHADYVARRDEWRTMFDLLEGDHECLTHPDYLWLHSMEDPARQCDERDKRNAVLDRRTRETRTRYTNFMEMARERWISLVMKGGLLISEEIEALLEDEIANVDGQGTSLEEFTEEACRHLISFGVPYVFTDAETREFRSRREERESGARPYLQLIHPLDLKDWQIGTDGQYQAFRYEYRLQQERESLEEEPILAHYTTIGSLVTRDPESGQLTYRIQTWVSVDNDSHLVNHHPDCTKDQRRIHADWQPVNELIVDQLDMLPLATSRIDDSVLKSGIPIALRIYNKESELDNILHGQCYDRIFLFSDIENTALDETGQQFSDEAKEIKISTNSLVVLPREGSVEKIDPTNPEALEHSIMRDIDNFFRVVFNQTRTPGSDSRAVESDRTLKEQKESLLTRIERTREKLIGVMNQALKHYAAFKGVPEFEGELAFAQAVTEADITEMLTAVNRSFNLINPYPGIVKEITKKVVAQFNLPNESDLFKEIDDTTLPSTDPADRAVDASRNRLQGLVIPRPENQSNNQRSPQRGRVEGA